MKAIKHKQPKPNKELWHFKGEELPKSVRNVPPVRNHQQSSLLGIRFATGWPWWSWACCGALRRREKDVGWEFCFSFQFLLFDFCLCLFGVFVFLFVCVCVCVKLCSKERPTLTYSRGPMDAWMAWANEDPSKSSWKRTCKVWTVAQAVQFFLFGAQLFHVVKPYLLRTQHFCLYRACLKLPTTSAT